MQTIKSFSFFSPNNIGYSQKWFKSMAGKLEGNLAALARLQGSGLSKGIDYGGKILISIVEDVAVCEVAHPVGGDGDSP
jgi:hypothetical protein